MSVESGSLRHIFRPETVGGSGGFGGLPKRRPSFISARFRRTVAVGIGMHLGPVDRGHAHGCQAGIRAQGQQFAEELGERALVTDDKARQRRVNLVS